MCHVKFEIKDLEIFIVKYNKEMRGSTNDTFGKMLSVEDEEITKKIGKTITTLLGDKNVDYLFRPSHLPLTDIGHLLFLELLEKDIELQISIKDNRRFTSLDNEIAEWNENVERPRHLGCISRRILGEILNPQEKIPVEKRSGVVILILDKLVFEAFNNTVIQNNKLRIAKAGNLELHYWK